MAGVRRRRGTACCSGPRENPSSLLPLPAPPQQRTGHMGSSATAPRRDRRSPYSSRAGGPSLNSAHLLPREGRPCTRVLRTTAQQSSIHVGLLLFQQGRIIKSGMLASTVHHQDRSSPPCNEDLEEQDIISFHDIRTTSDLRLECEAQAVHFRTSPRALNRKRVYHSSPAIRYRHIYECRSFFVDGMVHVKSPRPSWHDHT